MKARNGRAHQGHVLSEVKARMCIGTAVQEAASEWLAGAEAGEPAGKSFLPEMTISYRAHLNHQQNHRRGSIQMQKSVVCRFSSDSGTASGVYLGMK